MLGGGLLVNLWGKTVSFFIFYIIMGWQQLAPEQRLQQLQKASKKRPMQLKRIPKGKQDKHNNEKESWLSVSQPDMATSVEKTINRQLQV